MYIHTTYLYYITKRKECYADDNLNENYYGTILVNYLHNILNTYLLCCAGVSSNMDRDYVLPLRITNVDVDLVN